MNELFGTASPMWTAMPSAGVGLQIPTLFTFGGRPIAAPAFGSPAQSMGLSATSSGLQALPAPSGLPSNMYGPSGGVPPSAQQSFAAPAVMTAGFPYAFNSSAALLSPEAMGWVTPASLLAAVAMRRGQPQGPTNDREVEDFLYDAVDMLPGTSEVELRCENGRVTLTGSVSDKRTKRDIGEIAWAIPGINDLQNNVTITSRRRSRPNRDGEAAPTVPARK
jgi:hypothetical protein